MLEWLACYDDSAIPQSFLGLPSMKKPFFYRIQPADLLSELVQLPNDSARGEWVMRLAVELIRADPDSSSMPYARSLIEEAHDFRAKKQAAGSSGGIAKASSAIANPSSAIAKASSALANSSQKQKQKQYRSRKSEETTHPTFEEVRAYVAEKGYSVDPMKFHSYFEVGNWVDSNGNKVRSWKQKLLTWDRHSNVQKNAESLTPLQKAIRSKAESNKASQ